MMPLAENPDNPEAPKKRAIKCNLCRGYAYSNCVYQCPRGAVLRVDPLRYFDELALVMEAEQVDAIKWQRAKAEGIGGAKQDRKTKQRIKPRSTAFIWISLAFFALAAAGILAGFFLSPEPRTGGTPWGLGFGIGAAAAIFFAMFLGARKRMRNVSIGPMEVWTQFHMVIGILGFLAALAHAGFKITGIFTTMLMVVFALEILTGVLGQALYMTLPKILTRLERSGVAKLIEDLLEEELELQRGMEELLHKSPPEVGVLVNTAIKKHAGSTGDRFKKSYDPEKHPDWVRQHIAFQTIPERFHDVVDRLIVDVCRMQDVRAQLRLHRGMKHWLVAHIAIAAALFSFLIIHIIAMMLIVL